MEGETKKGKMRGLCWSLCNSHTHTHKHTWTLIAAWESTTYAADWTNGAEGEWWEVCGGDFVWGARSRKAKGKCFLDSTLAEQNDSILSGEEQEAAVASSIHSHFTQPVKGVWSPFSNEPLTQIQWLKRKDAVTASCLVIQDVTLWHALC